MLKSHFHCLRAVIRTPKYYHIKCMCTISDITDEAKEQELKKIAENPSIDEPPTTCCMSGCANCVYIVWAEALTAKMQTVTPEIANKIMSMVEDPSLKAYLEMELRLRGLKK